MKETVVGRLFYIDQIPNSERFNGLEDKGLITNGEKTAKVRIQMYNDRIIFIVPMWIKSLEGWKKL